MKKKKILCRIKKPLAITALSIALMTTFTACGDNEVEVIQTMDENLDANNDVQPTVIPTEEVVIVEEEIEVEELKTIEVYSDDEALVLFDEAFDHLKNEYGNNLSDEEITMFLCHFNATSFSDNFIFEKSGLTIDEIRDPFNIMKVIHPFYNQNTGNYYSNIYEGKNYTYINFSEFILDENLKKISEHLTDIYIEQFDIETPIDENTFLELTYFFSGIKADDKEYPDLYCTIDDDYLNNPSGEAVKDLISMYMVSGNNFENYTDIFSSFDEFKKLIGENAFANYTLRDAYQWDPEKTEELENQSKSK